MKEKEMRRVILFAFLAIALPTAALASSIDFTTGTFVRGTISRVSNGGLVGGFSLRLNGNLTQIHLDGGSIPNLGVGNGCFVAGDGSCTFTGGTITVSNAAGTMTLFRDTVQSGTITKTATTAIVSASLAPNSGTPALGSAGGLVSYSVSFLAAPSSDLTGGVGRVAAVAEPGSLGLLGTGLVGLAGLARRKLTLWT